MGCVCTCRYPITLLLQPRCTLHVTRYALHEDMYHTHSHPSGTPDTSALASNVLIAAVCCSGLSLMIQVLH